jgi:hypothetical protein
MAVRSISRTHHYTLKGRHAAGEVSLPITRAQARTIFERWAKNARRHAKKGHRTLFLMTTHAGRCFDRLTIETTHARIRSCHDEQQKADAHKRWVTQ